MDIAELLLFAHKQGASDTHLSAGEPPRIRVNGIMTPVKVPPMDKKEIHAMIYDILNDRQRKIFEETHDLDFSMELGDVARFRVNVFMQHRGEAAVFRTIPSEVLSFDKLGLPGTMRNFAKLEKGIVLVTGPTGSGKSTTLAAIVDLINNERHGHILTIEDPIEFVHKSKNCLINQREVGPHTHSFANALRGALREDPDVILVGEMRDLETISLALTAAETGHLVFGTLHTSSAPKTIDRIVDVFPAGEQAQIRTMFAESCRAVVSQVLLRKKDGKGRVAALEIMIGTPAVRNLIREGKVAQLPSALQTGQKWGMQTLDQHLKELVHKGVIKKEDAELYISDPELFNREF
ncbi:MAG: type IV pilus twitching motility protein PilT [Candidatus Glassbacteria bacterium]|nr:type IV pilus twitching motility protein PilT [Candidatus Glassbacteria bacterium]